MGNIPSPPTIFKEYEHKTGRRLIAAIQANSKEATEAAIEFCRHEFTKPITSSTANASDYETMHKRLENYLLTPKDIGDGMIFKKSPLELCKDLKSDVSAAIIIDHLNRLGVQLPSGTTALGSFINPDVKDRGVESVTVGFVNQERANTAKDRLKAFRDSKQPPS